MPWQIDIYSVTLAAPNLADEVQQKTQPMIVAPSPKVFLSSNNGTTHYLAKQLVVILMRPQDILNILLHYKF
jgi:hypothetical protein